MVLLAEAVVKERYALASNDPEPIMVCFSKGAGPSAAHSAIRHGEGPTFVVWSNLAASDLPEWAVR